LVRGKLQRVEGVVNIVAEHLSPLAVPVGTGSRDFR
jgi:error-prone DNA polymerase